MPTHRPPHPSPLPQARLGELATFRCRTRKRVRLGRGRKLRHFAEGEKQRPFSHPHPLADADTWSCKLAKASLLEKDRMRGSAVNVFAV